MDILKAILVPGKEITTQNNGKMCVDDKWYMAWWWHAPTSENFYDENKTEKRTHIEQN